MEYVGSEVLRRRSEWDLQYPGCVKSLFVVERLSSNIDCLKRPGSVAYGIARNWTTLSGVMIPVMGPRSAWLNVNVGVELFADAILLIEGRLDILKRQRKSNKLIPPEVCPNVVVEGFRRNHIYKLFSFWECRPEDPVRRSDREPKTKKVACIPLV